ncbi:MAG: hypothetical protein L3K03_03400 [Thermoplasmata archaeon]|nr:hypothetical protein [Thermoplasmata archaeon]
MPTSTNFHLLWDGSTLTGTAGVGIELPAVSSGLHWLTGVTANSSSSGWIWVASPGFPNPVTVSADTVLNLSFAHVHVGARLGDVTFREENLTPGTSWQLEFNGTTYSSDLPWINVTTHPGRYAIQSEPVIATNVSGGFAPADVGPWLSVTAGKTYSISYTPHDEPAAASSLRASSPTTWQIWVVTGDQVTLAATAVESGYGWAGWDGMGPGAYTGSAQSPTVTVRAPIWETADLYSLPPDQSNLTVTERGLPNGTSWGLSLGGASIQSSNATQVIRGLDECGVAGLQGGYRLQVPVAVSENATNLSRYLPTSYPSIVCPDSGSPVVVSFATEHFLTLEPVSDGIATASLPGSAVAGGSTWFGAGATLTLLATPMNGTQFDGWIGAGPGSYSGLNPSEAVTPSGSITERATFGAAWSDNSGADRVTFSIATSLPHGMVWRISVGSYTFESSGRSLNVTGLSQGQYVVTVGAIETLDALTRYTPAPASFQVNVTGNLTVPISYTVAFWAAISVIGPGATSIPAGWIDANTTLSLGAVPGPGALFVSWSGNGTGSYAGSTTTRELTIDGPVSEVATFTAANPTVTGAAASPAVGPTAGTGSAFLGGLPWFGLVLAGLVGVLATVKVRRRPAPPSEAPPAETPADLGDGTDPGGELPEPPQDAVQALTLIGAVWTWSVPVARPPTWQPPARQPPGPGSRAPRGLVRSTVSTEGGHYPWACSVTEWESVSSSFPTRTGSVGEPIPFLPPVRQPTELWSDPWPHVTLR